MFNVSSQMAVFMTKQEWIWLRIGNVWNLTKLNKSHFGYLNRKKDKIKHKTRTLVSSWRRSRNNFSFSVNVSSAFPKRLGLHSSISGDEWFFLPLDVKSGKDLITSVVANVAKRKSFHWKFLAHETRSETNWATGDLNVVRF